MENNLSKSVAYDYQIASACIADGHNENGKWVDWNNKLTRHCPPDWMMEEGKVTGLKLLYSQEYVSALRADAAKWFKAFEKAVSVGARYEERIAELEAEVKVWESATLKHLARAEEAEKRLATPVRLPDIRSDDYHETGWFQHMKYYRDVERSLRAAGFKVEGDK